VGASTSHNPIGLNGLLQGYLYLIIKHDILITDEVIIRVFPIKP
jgi:hypothetical protein